MNRRDLLKGSGALIVGFVASRGAATLAITGSSDVALAQAARTAADVDSWLVVGADGIVTAYTGKCELGQGLHTAQVQLVAEELDRAGRARSPGDVRHVANSRSGDDVRQPVASDELQSREPGAGGGDARARRCIALGATRLGVGRNAADGRTAALSWCDRDPAKRVAYADLVGGRTFDVPLDPEREAKGARGLEGAGHVGARVSISPRSSRVGLEFVHNVRLDGMLHGRVVRPPGPGATSRA